MAGQRPVGEREATGLVFDDHDAIGRHEEQRASPQDHENRPADDDALIRRQNLGAEAPLRDPGLKRGARRVERRVASPHVDVLRAHRGRIPAPRIERRPDVVVGQGAFPGAAQEFE
jgi:hypothetical protein